MLSIEVKDRLSVFWITQNNGWHRLDGPAVVRRHANGRKLYEVHSSCGYPHRLDGPAVVERRPDGRKLREDFW